MGTRAIEENSHLDLHDKHIIILEENDGYWTTMATGQTRQVGVLTVTSAYVSNLGRIPVRLFNQKHHRQAE